MTIEDDARTAVDGELARLRERLDEFVLVETRVENDPSFYEHGLDLVREIGMLADAGTLVRNPHDHVLLIRHPNTPETWGTPGGGYKGGDGSLAATAVREVREEASVECEIDDVLAVRVKTIEHHDEPRSFPMLTVEFAARGEGTATVAADEEVLAAAWFDDPPAALHDCTRDLLERSGF